jgi:hypothetical protein
MATSSRRQIVGGLLTTLTLVIAALISGSPGSSASAASDTAPTTGFYSSVEFSKRGHEGLTGSHLGVGFGGPACSSTSDPNCVISALKIKPYVGFGLHWTSIFPYCESVSQMNCVAGLTIRNSTTGLTEEAKFIGGTEIANRDDQFYRPFKGDLTRLIPDGGLAPAFTTNLFPLFSPNQFAFRVRVSMSGQSSQATCITAKEKQTSYCKSKSDPRPHLVRQFTMKVEKLNKGYGPIYNPYSFQEDLPTDAEFSIRLRLSTQLLPKGWLNGRVVRPGITQKVIADGYEIEVSGAVAQVPSTSVYFTCADSTVNKTLKKYLDKSWSSSRNYHGLPTTATCANADAIAQTPAEGRSFDPVIETDVLLGEVAVGSQGYEITEILDVFKSVNDAVGILRSQWSLNWTPEYEDPGFDPGTASGCNATGLVGVVGTTAALYGVFPIFEPTTGRLTYQMVGPHYLADGTLNTATMSMVMRRDYAMCQWGIDPAPDTMLVNIANSNSSVGNPAIISSKVEGDFFRVDASGITFSAPKMGIVAKAGKVKAAKSLFLKSGSSMPITKVVKARKGYVASWYVKKGSCRITARDTKTLRMAKKGSCEILITEFNKKSRTAKRTLLKLR